MGGFAKTGLAGPGFGLDIFRGSVGVNSGTDETYAGAQFFDLNLASEWGIKGQAQVGVQMTSISQGSQSVNCSCKK